MDKDIIWSKWQISFRYFQLNELLYIFFVCDIVCRSFRNFTILSHKWYYQIMTFCYQFCVYVSLAINMSTWWWSNAQAKSQASSRSLFWWWSIDSCTLLLSFKKAHWITRVTRSCCNISYPFNGCHQRFTQLKYKFCLIDIVVHMC